MDRITEIAKPAFIARVNQMARAFVVDTYYKRIGDSNDFCLMLVYSDGSEKPFTGLKVA